MEWPFLFTLHSYEHVPALNQFQIKQKNRLIASTEHQVWGITSASSCVFNPIQSRGSSSRPVCKKTCFKTFYGGELKNFPMQTNKTSFFFNLNKLRVIHRFKT